MLQHRHPPMPAFTARLTLSVLLVFALLAPIVMPGVAAQGSPEAAPNALLVRFRPGTSDWAKTLTRAQVHGVTTDTFELVPGLERIELAPQAGAMAEAAEALASLPTVMYVEPDYIIEIALAPNDVYYSSLYGLGKINAPQAWDLTTGSASVVVAAIDTGVDFSHPDLAANRWVNPNEIPNNGVDDDRNGYVDDVYGWDFVNNDNNPADDSSHGTHTAGTLGAVGNNGLGVAGVNWNAKIMALKIFNAAGSGPVSKAIAALDYAVAQGAQVSNLSWGMPFYSLALYDALYEAGAAGHLAIAAAGNNGSNLEATPVYPASYALNNVIGVAATDSDDARASFSSFSAASVEVAAPGVGILSTVPAGYDLMSGTSMAAPHVTGVAALIYGLHPDWNYAQVRSAILGSVRRVPALDDVVATGGIVDARAALMVSAPSTWHSYLPFTQVRCSGCAPAAQVQPATGAGP